MMSTYPWVVVYDSPKHERQHQVRMLISDLEPVLKVLGDGMPLAPLTWTIKELLKLFPYLTPEAKQRDVRMALMTIFNTLTHAKTSDEITVLAFCVTKSWETFERVLERDDADLGDLTEQIYFLAITRLIVWAVCQSDSGFQTELATFLRCHLNFYFRVYIINVTHSFEFICLCDIVRRAKPDLARQIERFWFIESGHVQLPLKDLAISGLFT